MDVNENLRNMSQQERDNIKEAYQSVYGKMRPNAKSVEYLYESFKKYIDPTFTGTCSRCKKRVVTYWNQRLKSWGMI